ncbi:subtilisin-like protease SBT3 [Nymphaea colorata]|nr:subtilisin-like protease SBT3 [Nymphaea colorata]
MSLSSTPLLSAFLTLFIFQLWTSASGKRDAYIVHMDVAAMPRAFSSHHHWYTSILSSESFIAAADDAAPSQQSSHIYTYSHAINGFSAVLSRTQLELLKRSPGFVAAYGDISGTKDTTYTYEYLGLSPVSGIWPASKYGEDIIIGVVDTGVWPESSSFRDDGMQEIPKRWKGQCEAGTAFNASMCNRKLIGARFFNRGLLAQDPNLTISMNSARDTDGHGTHTSSTAAGNYAGGASYFGYGAGTARGVAPRARLAMYKVIWNEGIVASDTLAAMDQAIADGVDVISLSMSYRRTTPLYENPIAVGAFAAMEKGIFVSTSAGNRGPESRSIRNGAPWILTVGATAIDRRFSGVVTLGNGASFVGSSLYIGNRSVKNLPLYYNESVASCSSPAELKDLVKKKVVVCEATGQSSVFETFVVADAKGAGALLLTNNSLVIRATNFECPASVLDPKDSAAIRKYVKTSKNPTVSLTFRRTFTGIKPAPTIAEFSSRGPSFGTSAILKPDIVAPGTLILAAYSPTASATTLRQKSFFSNFTLLSGTSMSCPHASGLAALLKSAHPDWSPATIRSAMMTTANILDNTGQPIDGGASPLAVGSGEINPNKAMDPGLVYDAGRGDYVKFLCALNLTRAEFQAIARNSSDYDRCEGGNLDLNYPSFISYLDSEQSSGVWMFQRTVTNVGEDGPTTYTAKLTTMKGFSVTVTPLKLTFQRKNQKASFSLTLEVKRPMKDPIVFGFLTWVDDQGKHTVRSPIVATTVRETED